MTDPRASGPNATSDALAGTQWELLTIDGEPASSDDVPLVITFGHDGRVSGSTGLNELTASYTVTADYLTFGPLATTRRAGSPELMAQEHRVVGSLAGMCAFRYDPRAMSIDGPLGRIELVNTNPPPEPAPLPSESEGDLSAGG